MDSVVSNLSRGGTGSLILLIAVILFGCYKFITDTMKKNDEREIRYQNTIDKNQKCLNDVVNYMQKDIDTMKDDIRIIKDKVV